MSDEIMQRLSTEGVDPLALAGVNDGNLVELAKRLGVRVSLRGDTLTLHGPLSAVERAAEVAQALVDLARMGDTLDVSDVDRVLSEEAQGTLGRAATGGPGGPGGPGVDGEYKIILPGLRRVIAPKTAGQRDYLHAIAQYDIVIGIGPAGTGKPSSWRPSPLSVNIPRHWWSWTSSIASWPRKPVCRTIAAPPQSGRIWLS